VAGESAAHVTAAVLGMAQGSKQEGNTNNSYKARSPHGRHLIWGDYIAETRQWRWIVTRKMEPTDWTNDPAGIFSWDQRRPRSHAGNYDLSVHYLHGAPDQGASPDAVQAITNPASFLDKVAFAFEDKALAVLELCHALAKAPPFRGGFHFFVITLCFGA
jgi:hypothetical protein